MSYFTLGRESGLAPERIFNPKLSAGGVDQFDVATCWSLGIVPRRAPHRTGDLSGPKVTPAMSADVTDCLRENLVEMLGAFEASRKLAIRRS